MKPTYQNIEALIVKKRFTNHMVEVTFKAPNADREIKSRASLRRGEGTVNEVRGLVGDSVGHFLHNLIRKSVRNVLGGGIVGQTGSRVAERLTYQQKQKLAFGGGDKEEAVVEAFKRVQSSFRWDDNQNTWVSASEKEATEISSRSLDSGYDKEVMLRILYELAESDKGVSYLEKEFIRPFLEGTRFTLENIAAMPPLSRIELEGASAAGRDHIFVMATALVLVDKETANVEKKLLLHFAQNFDYSTNKVNRLIRVAKHHILEEAVLDGLSRKELMQIADEINVDHETAERVMVDFKKRTM